MSEVAQAIERITRARRYALPTGRDTIPVNVEDADLKALLDEIERLREIEWMWNDLQD